MNKITLLALSVSSALLTFQVNAANQVADARGNAMGNTGVASADYLVAPFYNPALAANFKDNDDFAFLLPAVVVSARDTDDSLDTMDDLQDAIDDYENATIASQDQVDTLNGYLNQLEGNAPLTVTAGVGFAIAIPTKTVSVNLFAQGYAELVVVTHIGADAGNNAIDVVDRYQNSNVDILAFGYSEMGLALAKEFTIANQQVSFGITPKYQKMRTYTQNISVSDFDIDEYDENEINKNAFNFDLGAMWYKDNLRAGLAIKDILAQEIDAAYDGGTTTYELNPQVTVGLAYASEFFTAALDADLTKQTRFKDLDDDTQFVRIGIEGNAWNWAQLRAGYEVDLESTLDNSVTAGLGFSPFDVVNLDIAGSYAGDNQFGVSANLAFTF